MVTAFLARGGAPGVGGGFSGASVSDSEALEAAALGCGGCGIIDLRSSPCPATLG